MPLDFKFPFILTVMMLFSVTVYLQGASHLFCRSTKKKEVTKKALTAYISIKNVTTVATLT